METFKNRIEKISIVQCGPIAEQLHARIAGYADRKGVKFDRLKNASYEIRERIANRIDCQVVYSCFDDVYLEGRTMMIGTTKFNCPAFEWVEPGRVKGVCVYMATAGNFNLENESLMDQLLADFWGTAFIDAGRLIFENKMKQETCISNAFGPGFYGMEASQMVKIPMLVDNSLINVSVRENGLLVPLKSCAGIYLLSDRQFPKMDPGCATCRGTVLSCSFCNMKGTKG